MKSLYHNMKSLYRNTSLYIIIWQVYSTTEDVKAKNVAQCNIQMQATAHMLTTILMHFNCYLS